REKPIVEPDLGLLRAARRQPMQIALYFARVGSRRAGAGVRVVRAMHRGDVARGVLVRADALDDVSVAQARLRPRRETEVALLRMLLEIVALDPQLARERQ